MQFHYCEWIGCTRKGIPLVYKFALISHVWKPTGEKSFACCSRNSSLLESRRLWKCSADSHCLSKLFAAGKCRIRGCTGETAFSRAITWNCRCDAYITIINQGDDGENFNVLESGAFDICVGGNLKARRTTSFKNCPCRFVDWNSTGWNEKWLNIHPIAPVFWFL